ncbi:MAG: hypothetical protein JNK15_25835 [Planctomycetes bacterium]|nr:hypothetical protein [Planctomycetota bacterium]
MRSAAVVLLGTAALAAQELRPLGPGPTWLGPRPTARNEVFATADGCAGCHSMGRRSLAMTSATGADVSPHALWRASVMANAARDPFWRAQVAKEVAADPGRAEEVQAQCVRCHAPMVSHTRRLGGEAPADVATAVADPLGRDGVSCAVCHQIRAEGLGTEATFGGKGRIDKGRTIFGPYERPLAAPMQDMAVYDPVHGPHVQTSGLCATCHTLVTEHAGEKFPEQTPFFEWRNSEFTDEPARTATSRTCQECHMAELGATRIARHPNGTDFTIEPRSPYRSHGFVGANAFLLDLFAQNREALGVDAPEAALRLNARASRRLLAEATVAVAIDEPQRKDGVLHFTVRVDNLAGHKFPTGFPSRRAWLHVQVRAGAKVVFDSGGYDRDGRLLQVPDPLDHDHVTHVDDEGDVVVWELVAADAEGAPTTSLTRMQRPRKDTRLLPRGWTREGPHAETTRPVGLRNDFDFTGGGDTVGFAIPFAAGAQAATIVAWVRYQPIPPHWVDGLRDVDSDACRSFVKLYDAADKTPEVCGVAVREER